MKHKNLPENYKLHEKIDFENDKKMAIRLSWQTIAIAVVMFVAAAMFRRVCAGGLSIWINLAIAFGGCIIYSLLHELIHAAYISIFLREKPQFKFTFPYLCVGCDSGYFSAAGYAFYALSPIIILGAVIAWIGAMLPANYFWCVYIIQIFNVSGITSDIYAIMRIAKSPKKAIAQDSGREVYIFAQREG